MMRDSPVFIGTWGVAAERELSHSTSASDGSHVPPCTGWNERPVPKPLPAQPLIVWRYEEFHPATRPYVTPGPSPPTSDMCRDCPLRMMAFQRQPCSGCQPLMCSHIKRRAHLRFVRTRLPTGACPRQLVSVIERSTAVPLSGNRNRQEVSVEARTADHAPLPA